MCVMFGDLSEIVRFLNGIRVVLAWVCVFLGLGILSRFVIGRFPPVRFCGLPRIVVFVLLCAHSSYYCGSKTNGIDGVSEPMSAMSVPELCLSGTDATPGSDDVPGDAYRISSISVNSNDVSLSLGRSAIPGEKDQWMSPEKNAPATSLDSTIFLECTTPFCYNYLQQKGVLCR